MNQDITFCANRKDKYIQSLKMLKERADRNGTNLQIETTKHWKEVLLFDKPPKIKIVRLNIITTLRVVNYESKTVECWLSDDSNEGDMHEFSFDEIEIL